jgi:hypothetical protein
MFLSIKVCKSIYIHVVSIPFIYYCINVYFNGDITPPGFSSLKKDDPDFN